MGVKPSSDCRMPSLRITAREQVSRSRRGRNRSVIMPGRISIAISLLGSLVVSVGLENRAAGGSPAQGSSSQAKADHSANSSQVEKLIVAQTNEFRQEQGRAAVKPN